MIKKNIMLLFLSVFHKDKSDNLSYNKHKLYDGRVVECSQTNEAPVMDIAIELAKNGEHLDYVYCITTDEVFNQRYSCVDRNVFHEYNSQWELFIEHIRNSLPEIVATEFVSIKYLEKDKDDNIIDTVTASKKCVNSMLYSLLEKLGDNVNFNECRLYTDITGGYRNTTMLLLSMLQLLQYSGMEIGRVIYSALSTKGVAEETSPNIISDFSSINNLFTLIAGADAFVKYGSSIAIEQFFNYRVDGNNEGLSQPLTNLLGSMHRFSDVIQICQTGGIMPAIDSLAIAIKEFRDYKKENEDEKIFFYLLKTIENGYGEILKYAGVENIDKRLAVIEWCTNKSFYQQAMTLCTEWLPTIIVEKKICYTDNDKVINECKKIGAGNTRTWYQQFIIDYTREAVPKLPAASNCLKKSLEYFIGHDDDEVLKPLSGYTVDTISTLYITYDRELLKLQRLGPLTLERVNKSIVFKVLNKIWENKCKSNTYNVSFCNFMRSIKGRAILKECGSWSKENIKTILKIDRLDKESKSNEERETLNIQEKIMNKVDNRVKQCSKMMSDGIMKTAFSSKDSIDILSAYHFIRQYRNQINHANNSFRISLKYLHDKIIETILRIRKIM